MTYVFNNKYVLAAYICKSVENPIDVRVNKAMYELWNLYHYLAINEEASYHTENLVMELFRPNFVAGKWGPYDPDVVYWFQKAGNKNCFTGHYYNTLSQGRQKVLLELNPYVLHMGSVNAYGLAAWSMLSLAYQETPLGERISGSLMTKNINQKRKGHSIWE